MQVGYTDSYNIDCSGVMSSVFLSNYPDSAGQDNFAKRSNENKRDSVEISSKAYKMQADEKDMRATSGNDYLGISRGSGENSFVIHFSDSAMVNRVVSRGYITVNGVNIPLPDEIKKKLTTVDKEAQSKREAAFMKYVSDFNMAVAKQQSEALSSAYKDMSKGMKIAMKLLAGKKVSKEEMELLMRTNPDLYDMIMALRQLNKNEEKKEFSSEYEADNNVKSDEGSKGVSWSNFEWKSYETCLDVSLDGDTQVGDMSIEEVTLN